MIVREIKQNKKLIENFDWFNDYRDTRDWCVSSCPEMVPLLDAEYEYWLEQRKKEFQTKHPHL